MSRQEQKMGRSVRWQSINVATQVVLQIVFLRVLGAYLVPGEWGLMGIALAIVGIIEIFAQIGVGPSLIQRKNLEERHIAAAFWLSTLLGIVFTAAIYFAAPAVANIYGDMALVPVLRWIGLSFTLAGLALVPRSILLRRMDFQSLFWSSLSSMLLANWVVGIGMAIAGYGLWSYAVALIVQNALLGVNFWWRARVRIRGGMPWAALQPLLRYGTGSTLFNVFNYGATKLDVLVLGYFLPGTAESRMARTGLYERGTYVMGLPITMLGKLSDSVLFSGMSSVQSDPKALERIFLAGVYYVMWLVVPGVVLLELYSREVVLLLLGPALLGSVPIVQILMLGVLVRGLVKVCDALVRAVDAVWAAAAIKGGFMLWVTAAAWWGATIGLEAVAWGVVAGTVLQCAFMLGLTSRRVGVRAGRILRKAIPGLVVGALAGVGGVAGYALPEDWGVARLALGSASAGLVLLCGTLVAPWIFAQGEHALLADLAGKLPDGRLKSRWSRPSKAGGAAAALGMLLALGSPELSGQSATPTATTTPEPVLIGPPEPGQCSPAVDRLQVTAFERELQGIPFQEKRLEAMFTWTQNRCLTTYAATRLLHNLDDEVQKLDLACHIVSKMKHPEQASELASTFNLKRYRQRFETWLGQTNFAPW